METSLRFLTRAEFEEYKAYVEGWLAALGMTGWEVHFNHEQGGRGEIASVGYSVEDKCATFHLSEYVEPGTRDDVNMEYLALHEVLHLLVADMLWTASRPRADDSVIIAHEHDFINRMMKVLL